MEALRLGEDDRRLGAVGEADGADALAVGVADDGGEHEREDSKHEEEDDHARLKGREANRLLARLDADGRDEAAEHSELPGRRDVVVHVALEGPALQLQHEEGDGHEQCEQQPRHRVLLLDE